MFLLVAFSLLGPTTSRYGFDFHPVNQFFTLQCNYLHPVLSRRESLEIMFTTIITIFMQTYNLQLFVLADCICLFLRLSSDQIQFYDQNSTFSSSCTQTSNIASAVQINTSALEDEIWFLQPDIQMKAELLLDIFGTSMRETKVSQHQKMCTEPWQPCCLA